MILPGFIFFLIFKYAPLFGIVIAFQDYDPFSGFWHSPWVGMGQFKELFQTPDFFGLLKNTMLLSAMNLFLFFPAPIILALLMNEIRLRFLKSSMQTIVYMPHFISWVVVVSITVVLFASQEGSINIWLASHGFERMSLLTDPRYFRWIYLFQNIWKETGWNAILFLAALASIDPSLYEAAVIDGASRWRQVWHINLPALRNVIVILFILRLGHTMEIGFEHIYLLQNPLNQTVSDIFDTYVYRVGILNARFSFTTAVGLFKSVVGLILVIIFNWLAKRMGEEGVY
jgi:putative aldouronate transport system permease protein